jgi:chemotaxis protein MotB
MAAKKPHEEHVNHERYMVTYADLITLLLAFFIILYAMSDVNKAKFEQLASSLEVAFNSGSPTVLNLEVAENKEIKKRQTATTEEMTMMKAVKEQNELRRVQEQIDKKIEEEGLQDKVKTQLSEEGLKILLTDDILFLSGNATLKDESLSIISTISTTLITLENPVQVNGFTDNIPIQTAEFPSNWELSSARALSVLRYMLGENKDLVPTRFAATGYGEYKPITTNDTSEGRNANRRVEILIERLNSDGLMKENEEVQ